MSDAFMSGFIFERNVPWIQRQLELYFLSALLLILTETLKAQIFPNDIRSSRLETFPQFQFTEGRNQGTGATKIHTYIDVCSSACVAFVPNSQEATVEIIPNVAFKHLNCFHHLGYASEP